MSHLVCSTCFRPLTRKCQWGAAADYDEDPAIRTPASRVPSGLLICWTAEQEAQRLPVVLTGGKFADRPTSPAGAIVANPTDIVRENVRPTANDYGCCGSSGLSGPNRACVCGSVVGTEWSDCWTEAEVRFDPGSTSVVD